MKKSTVILRQVRETIRHPYAWPGGYPVYTTMADSSLLCPQCARENYKLISAATREDFCDRWQAIGTEIYWEGPAEDCAHCGEPLESAYGPVETTIGDQE